MTENIVGSIILVEPDVVWGPRAKNLTGQKIGMLTAVRVLGRCAYGQAVWLFRCDCGNYRQIRANAISGSSAKSCGCATMTWHKRPKPKNATHKLSKHPAYAVWNMMRQRCENPKNKGWKNYGARGIKICDGWKESFENFWSDMGATYASNLTIERKNNNGNYEPENCVWATQAEQALNTRQNVTLNTPYGSMSVRKASELFNLPEILLRNRARKGLPMERLFAPVGLSNRPWRIVA